MISITNSSNILGIHYDSSNFFLEVTFKNGTVYRYLDIPKEIYETFLVSPSKGKFLHENIKKFKHFRVK